MLRFIPELARRKPPVIVMCGVDGRARTETIERLLERGGNRWAVISNDVDGPEFAAAAVETSPRDDLPQFLRLSRERAERAARAAADPSIPF